jgi:hypothetical protein
MFGSEVLEVGAGLALLFLFVSLICTATVEGIEALLKKRAKDLERGIREMLGNGGEQNLVEAFYKHPLIHSLFAGDYDRAKLGNLPSYIPAGNFATAIMDIVVRGPEYATAGRAAGNDQLSVDSFRSSAQKVTDPKLQRVLLSAIDTAQGDINLVKASLEAWFNGTMDRVSGWFRRRTQGILFFIGLAAAACLNIDAITVAQRLSHDQALRQAAVAQASAFSEVGAAAGTAFTDLQKQRYAELENNLRSIGYPIGWQEWWPAPQRALLLCGDRTICIRGVYLPAALGIALGWLITALAVMLGAPFWFDVLNKFIVIRSTVKPREKSQEEASEDRQQAPPPGRNGATAQGR